jgi:hypothetical protein
MFYRDADSTSAAPFDDGQALGDKTSVIRRYCRGGSALLKSVSKTSAGQMTWHIMYIPALGCCNYSRRVVFWQRFYDNHTPELGMGDAEFSNFALHPTCQRKE